MRIALFQPDIPQNTGAILRLAACLGVSVEVIEPCGFVWNEARMRRAGLDYLAAGVCRRFASWEAFLRDRAPGRLILFSTRGRDSHVEFRFHPQDTLLFGRESAGVPDTVHDAADASVYVPLAAGMRSLNLVTAAAIGLGEALRQTGSLPVRD